jgi:hypothetical protein
MSRRRRAALAAGLASLVLLGTATAVAATPATPAASPTASTGPSAGQTAPGIQVGPPPPASTGPAGPTGTVGGDQPSSPAFWDLPGRVRKAIDDWFRGLVVDALTPMLQLVGETVLSTPQLGSNAQIGGLWQISLIAADSLLVLFVLVAAGLAMSHDTLQTQYALKDLVGRLAFAGIMINASLSLADQLAGICNGLASAFLGDGATAASTAASLQNLIVGALSGGGIFLVLLGLGCAIAAVMLLVLYLLRAAIVVVLVCAAPLVLLAHLFPQTEGLAHLWWRVLAAAFAIQVSQAIVLAACVRVFFSGGPAGLGLSVTGSVVDLLLCLCLLYVLVRIPFWAKQIAFSGRGSSTVRLVKAYAIARAIGSVR